MSVSIHQAAVPAILQILDSLSAIIDKAAAHCEARKIDPAVLISYRLAPDMYAFARQIQVTTDQAKGITARLAGVEMPSLPDVETSFDELKARIAKVADFVKSLPAAEFEGAEARTIPMKLGSREVEFTGADYLFGFGLPNFYFHAAAAYDILRHAGVAVGKRDFLGAIPIR
ncbi:MAG TPA: DUF1993 domain-containing protein [Aliidongia sp.]|uniref:DUF1993 domain-containing protein n=1 Tax=Aliidongia sp. TaxID=1914230 RepID=UPI002DDD5A1C|nr:DUF1993 domain-containing protein [Aliidongia sp.]HEV2674964.1 DUF1993 domain-containing protein [Aliidongia sp.]